MKIVLIMLYDHSLQLNTADLGRKKGGGAL